MKRAITRKDFERYRSGKNNKEREELEKQSVNDPFLRDALAGWEQLPAGYQPLRRADRKFSHLRKARLMKLSFYVVTGGLLAGSVSFWGNNGQAKQINLAGKVNTIVSDQPKQLASTEPESKIRVSPDVQTVKNNFIYRNNKSTNAILSDNNKLTSDHDPEWIFPMPLKSPELPEQTLTIKQEHDRHTAKEIYLYSLKLVDYSVYRDAEKHEETAVLPSGTEASLENGFKQQEAEDQSTTYHFDYNQYLSKTMRYFSKGEEAIALSRFYTILNTYPEDVNALFYGGLCQYHRKNYEQAIKLFKKSISEPFDNFLEESSWYLAKSLVENGQFTEARELLQQISVENQFYAKQARELLKKLNISN